MSTEKPSDQPDETTRQVTEDEAKEAWKGFTTISDWRELPKTNAEEIGSGDDASPQTPADESTG